MPRSISRPASKGLYDHSRQLARFGRAAFLDYQGNICPGKIALRVD